MSFSQPPTYQTFVGNNYNPSSFPSASSTGLTLQSALGFLLSYPNAQGKETLLDTDITGDLLTFKNITFNINDLSNNQFISEVQFRSQNNIILDTSGTYIQFPDGSKQYTSPIDDINTVYNDVSNTFFSGTVQTFNGNNNSSSLNAPIVIKNYDNGDGGSLYLDPSGNYDITLFSNQSSNAGLTVRNPSYSFTVNPTSGNVASFINPVSSTYRITGNGLTTTSNLIFPDATTQTTAFTTNLLSVYATSNNTVLTGVGTYNGQPIATTNLLTGFATSNNTVLTGVGTYNGQPIATTNLLTGFATSNNPVLTGVGTYNGQPIATTNLLSSYAPLASPILTGNPQAPTPATTDNDTSIATTNYVKLNLLSYATLASPILTGNPQAPTPITTDNDTTIATTAYVQSNLLGLTKVVSNTISAIFFGTVSAYNSVYVFSGPNFCQVLISGLIFKMTNATNFPTIYFTNDLYSPPSKNPTACTVTGYLANGSTLISFTSYLANSGYNSIGIQAFQSLSTNTHISRRF